MKRFLQLILTLVVVTSFAWTQEDNTIPPIPPKRSKAIKVGAFGGFTPGWLFVDVNPINAFLQPSGVVLKDDGMLMLGGAGAAYIMLVPNLRVGGMGMGGSIKSTLLNVASGIRRDAELHVGFGGVTVEYVVPVVERLDVAFGGMLGGGGIDITLRQDNGNYLTWDQEGGNFGSGNYQGQVGGPISNITRKLSGSYFVWIPSVSVEYAVKGWAGVRVGASYVGMSAPSWQVDDKYELLGVPSKVNGKGFMINAGLFVGTF